MAILELQRRQTEVGRIRLGHTVQTANGRSRPERLETFRFTSPSKRLIEAIAERYGGEVRPWTPPRGSQEWEVITDTASVPVVVPPQDVESGQFYELWSAGGCQRRCNGVRELLSDQPCLCDPENRECSMHTRINLMLRDVPGLGVWRLDTGGYYAAVELPGMVSLLAQTNGLVPAVLELRQRTVTRDNQTRRFVVPVLHVEEFTPGQLIAGEPIGRALASAAGPAAVGAGPAGEQRALPAAPAPAESMRLRVSQATDRDALLALWKEAERDGLITGDLKALFERRGKELAASQGQQQSQDGEQRQYWLDRIRSATTLEDLRPLMEEMNKAGVKDNTVKQAWWERKRELVTAGQQESTSEPPAQSPAPVETVAGGSDEEEPDPDAVWTTILRLAGERGWKTPEVSAKFRSFIGKDPSEANGWELDGFRKALKNGEVQ